MHSFIPCHSTSAFILLLVGCSCSPLPSSSLADPGDEETATARQAIANLPTEPQQGSETAGMKKVLLFTSQKGTTLSAYFASFDEYKTLPPWEPPAGPDIDVKQLATKARKHAHTQVADGENWKLSECSFKNADLAEGTIRFQYAEFTFICKSAKEGWTSVDVYMNLSGNELQPETYEFPDYDALEDFRSKLNETYATWSK